MDENVVGNVLEIPEGLLKDLQKIDRKINSIAKHSEDMGNNFNTAMSAMTTSASNLRQQMEQIYGIVGVLKKFDINGNNVGGLNDVADEAEEAASNVTQLANAFSRINPKDMNIAELTQEIKDLNKMLTEEGGVKDKGEQIQIENRKRALEEELKWQKKSSKERIDIYRKEYETRVKELEKLVNQERNIREANTRAKNSGNRVNQDLRERELMYARMFDMIERRTARIDSMNRRYNYNRYVTSTEGSLRIAESDKTNTYAKRATAIKNLETAIKNLRTTDRNYQKDLQRLTDAHQRLTAQQRIVERNFGRIQKSQSHLMDTSGQLARKLALIFSVSQIQGYIMNVVRVTGEFEKQNVALASILQNKDKADKLFAQVTELAVKSPFQLKELVTYTKSLSAYQVEYEKLFDTTKRLADVSAGLGVDMQRLILAFGQVKAANYLRGTEVRQFTEAGLNILGELAKYYGELENRMVSVGEVQEMVTKRMVSFGDVEEVFKRVTSAGGIFYEMQERQAETLAGQISNLYDSIDIMLNDIGSANDGTIKDMIALVRNLLQNWRDLAFSFKVVSAELSPFIAYMVLAKASSTKLGLAISSLGKNLLISAGIIKGTSTAMSLADIKAKMLTLSITALKTALKGIATLGVGLAIGAIIVAVEKLIVEGTRASRMAAELKEKLDNLFNEGDYNAAKLSNGFRQLAEKILDSNTSVDEQNEALKELKRTYGEILPSQSLTTKGLEAMKGNYDEITKAIYAKIEAQVKEKQITAVSETYGRDVEQSFDKVKDMLVKEQGLLPQDATKVVTKLRQALEDGTLKIGQDYTAFVENIIKESYHMNAKIRESFTRLEGTSFFGKDSFKLKEIKLPNKEIEDFSKSVFKMKEQIDKINEVKIFPFGGSSDYDALEKEMERVKESIAKARKEVAEDNKGKSSFFINEAQNKREKEIIQDWVNTFKKGLITIKDAYGKVVNPTSATSLKFIEDIQKQLDSVDGNKMQKEVREVIRSFAELNDVSLIDINKVLMQSSQTMGDYRKQVEGDIKSIEERLEQYNKGYSGFITQIFNNNDRDKAKQTLDLLKAIQLALFPQMPKKSGGENPELKRLKEQIELLKKVGEEYEKLRKYYSIEESDAMIKKNFAESFNNLGLDIDMNFDAEGVEKGLRDLYKTTGEDGKKEIDKALAPLEDKKIIKIGEEGLDEIKKEIEDIFSNYEFSMDLQSAGIDPTEFREMLKSLGADDAVIASIGLDTTSFEETINKLEEKKQELLLQGGKEQEKQAEELEKKITAMILKEAKNRLSELTTLREKYSEKEEKIERINADVERWKEELKAIEESGEKANAEQKELLELRIRNGQDAIRQLQSEALQLTSFWRRTFGELENLSTKSLREILKVNSQIFDSAEEVKNKKGEVSQYIATYETKDKDGNMIKKQVTLTVEQYQRLLKQNNKVFKELEKKNPFEALWENIKKGKNKDESTLDYMERLKGSIKGVSDVTFEAAGNIADIFNADDDVKQTMSDIQDITNGTLDAGIGIARLASGDVLGGAMQALKGVASIFSSIGKIGDRKKEKAIKKQLDLIDKLSKAYDKLKESIDNAYAIDTLDKSTRQAQANLEAQNNALEAAIKKEDDKKKTDKERIKEWEEQIEANNERIKELQEERIAALGGVGSKENIKSAAQSFADAWYQAFKETGDGLVGLEGNFEDMFDNIIKKQIMMKTTEKFLKPFFDQIDAIFKEANFGSYMDNYMNGITSSFDGANATKEELQAVLDKSKEVFPAMNEYLKQLMESLGIQGGKGEEGDKLSGLQKGIQGITEQTAEALEAITESIRFFSADSNMQLKQIANALTNPEFESPMISELRLQTEQLRLMYSLWNSFGKSKSGISGKVLKVEIV